ncbi:MAG TPA: hypothetical protein VF559_01900 [Caulobacteraceae bacterium]|jgi:hypothetical protein
MPDKHPNTQRWGGPGASHEDRTKEPPDPTVRDPDEQDRTRHSQVSGGGGEQDIHHSHNPAEKGDFEAGDATKRKHHGER